MLEDSCFRLCKNVLDSQNHRTLFKTNLVETLEKVNKFEHYTDSSTLH